MKIIGYTPAEHAKPIKTKMVSFYDRHARTWTAYLADERGYQVSACQHAHTVGEIKALKTTDFELYSHYQHD